MLPKPKPRKGTEYRIRFKPSENSRKLLGEVLTAYPGIIRNNRPRAEKYLASLTNREAWLERRTTLPLGDWERMND